MLAMLAALLQESCRPAPATQVAAMRALSRTRGARLPGAELPGRPRLRRQHAHLRRAPASVSAEGSPMPVR